MSPLSGRDPFITQLGKFTYARGGNNLGDEICSDVVVDEKFETSYCLGSTNGSLAKPVDGARDAFIAKFDRKGKLLWVKQYSSSDGRKDGCTSGGIDQDGNIYCGGSTNGMMSSSPEWYDTGDIRDSSDTDNDAFIMKLNPDGDVIWIKQFGTSKEDFCGNLAVSPSGNSYCGARTTGALGDDNFGDPEGHVPNVDIVSGLDLNFDAYIAKFDTNGNLLWKRQIGTAGYTDEADYADICSGIAIDAEENVTCTGFTLGSLVEPNGGGEDLILWSFTKDGNERFLKQLGQNSEAQFSFLNSTLRSDQGYDVATDPRGNIYVAGFTTSDLLGGNTDLKQDSFLLKFDIDGNLIRGAQAHFAGNQSVQALTVTSNEEPIILAYTDSDAYGPVGGGGDIFVVKLKSDFSYAWTKQFGADSGLDSAGTESAAGITLDKAGNIYIGGSTSGNFGETNASANNDMFVLRMTKSGDFK